MPVVAGSAVSAVTTQSPAAGFAPSGVFVVRVLAGSCWIECQIPGTTEWLNSAELQGNRVAFVRHETGTAVAITPDIAGTKYRFAPIGDAPLTADAWSA